MGRVSNLLLAVTVVARAARALNLGSLSLPTVVDNKVLLDSRNNKLQPSASRANADRRALPIQPRSLQNAQHDESHSNILVAWTPRAGCTFVMEIWFRFLGCYEEAVAYNPFLHEYRTKVLKDNKNGGAATTDDIFGKSNFKFKVVMNPYHRAVTMYEIAMEAYPECFPESSGNFSFIEFLQYLQHDNEQTGLKGPDDCYHFHYAPQVALETNDASLYDLICRLEDDMGHCFSEIYSRTGYDLSLPRSGAGDPAHHNHEHQHVDGDVPNMPYTVFPRHALSTDFYVGESGRQAAGIVQALYRYDFEAYGYDMGMLTNFIQRPSKHHSVAWYEGLR